MPRPKCIHGKQKDFCKACGGSQICTHGKARGTCKACGGSQICSHGKQRVQCKECVTASEMSDGNRFCIGCYSKLLSQQRRRAGIRLCQECDASKPQRIEVLLRPQIIQNVKFPPSAIDDTLFGNGCDVSRRRRPDLAWFGEDRAILLEIDENGGHGTMNYSAECDFGWIMDMTVCINKIYIEKNNGILPNVFFIRFNPDEYDKRHIPLSERIETVSNRINEMLESQSELMLVPSIEYFYYHTKCKHHIEYAQTKDQCVSVIIHE